MGEAEQRSLWRDLCPVDMELFWYGLACSAELYSIDFEVFLLSIMPFLSLMLFRGNICITCVS
jgi:hypothetical protein